LSEAVVVDTDVISLFFKDDSRAELYAPYISDRLAVISFMTVAELDLWVETRGWGSRKRAQLKELLRPFTRHQSSPALCRLWARVVAQARRNGRPIECADAWIAATALQRAIPLVTHNGRHYDAVEGLEIICEA